MNKLRIALFTSSDPAITGGVQEHILYLTNELRKLGHSVDIFGPTGKNKRYHHYFPISDLIEIPIPGGSYTYITLLKSSFDISKIFTSRKYDIIHIHEPYIPLAAWTIIDRLRMPTIATFHTAWDDASPLNLMSGIIPLFKEQFSNVVQSSIFVSHATQKVWKNICSDLVLKTIIPNAVDINSFKPKNTTNKLPIILFVARLVSRKGVLHLLKAAQYLKKKGVTFQIQIMGVGKEKNEMLSFIKAHDMSSYVRYLGEIRGRDRYKYFSDADIFCAPYVNEAAPLTILEAIASGLPIVGFMNNSFKEILSNYPAKDLLVKPTDDKALAHALESLIYHQERIAMLKQWCLKQRRLYSWKKVAKTTADLYYKIIRDYAKKTV